MVLNSDNVAQNSSPHKSVLLEEMLRFLDPKDGESYIDATFGAGGYTSAILSKANCRVLGIDRDESVKKFADEISKKFQDRLEFRCAKFSQILEVTQNRDFFDGIVMDLGVSSMQLDIKERGFSFTSSARLDMRMGSADSITAFDVVNNTEESELKRIIKDYGEEAKARSIAHAIVKKRALGPITTCLELADIVRSVYPRYISPSKIDPATKTFQAIRIYVNDELNEIKSILDSALELLKPGGRIVVVSFHSLEDGIVKRFFKEHCGVGNEIQSRYSPSALFVENLREKRLDVITKAPITPSDSEVDKNIRSRSSKMRIAKKL